jgi:hypothetical protein
MINIKEKIEQLSIQERRQLSHAFDCQVAQFVKFGDNEFVGVHIDPSHHKNLKIKKVLGVWSYGTIN